MASFTVASTNSLAQSLFQMYISLVCPNLEYASQVWSPYKVGETTCIKGVQRFALHMCPKNWDASYQELLQLFSLPNLQQRRVYLDLCSMFRIVHGLFPWRCLLLPQCWESLVHWTHTPLFVLLLVRVITIILMYLVLLGYGIHYLYHSLIILISYIATHIIYCYFLCPMYSHWVCKKYRKNYK